MARWGTMTPLGWPVDPDVYITYAKSRVTWCPIEQSRSEEHTSELQSPDHLVCRLLLEKKKKRQFERAVELTDREDDPFLSTVHERLLHAHRSPLVASQPRASCQPTRGPRLDREQVTLS